MIWELEVLHNIDVKFVIKMLIQIAHGPSFILQISTYLLTPHDTKISTALTKKINKHFNYLTNQLIKTI
jgi:hypothetical protein